MTKIGGRTYVEIPPKDVASMDYVILPGRRVRMVSRVTTTNGRLVVHLEAFQSGKMVLSRARRVGLGDIESAWRWNQAEAVDEQVSG